MGSYSDFSRILGQIEETADNRHRHWLRITRCALHEYPYRVDRIRVLTRELDDLYAEKRRLKAQSGRA